MGWHAAEGRSWSLALAPSGAAVAEGLEDTQDAAVHATASELLLALAGRIPLDRLRVEGDHALVEELPARPNPD